MFSWLSWLFGREKTVAERYGRTGPLPPHEIPWIEAERERSLIAMLNRARSESPKKKSQAEEEDEWVDTGGICETISHYGDGSNSLARLHTEGLETLNEAFSDDDCFGSSFGGSGFSDD